MIDEVEDMTRIADENMKRLEDMGVDYDESKVMSCLEAITLSSDKKCVALNCDCLYAKNVFVNKLIMQNVCQSQIQCTWDRLNAFEWFKNKYQICRNLHW